MITAVDTNILLDVFGADPSFGIRSKTAIRTSLSEGRLVACEVVWAEVAGIFPSPDEATWAMGQLGVEFGGLSLDSALMAGTVWKSYREKGGKRNRMVADFLIGAHALVDANRLLTRDRGYYRTYFKALHILDVSKR